MNSPSKNPIMKKLQQLGFEDNSIMQFEKLMEVENVLQQLAVEIELSLDKNIPSYQLGILS